MFYKFIGDNENWTLAMDSGYDVGVIYLANLATHYR